MLSYIKSEFYRLLRNKWTYLFILICSGLLVAANIVLAAVKAGDATFRYATTKFSLSIFSSSIIIVFILCMTVASMVFGNEHSNHTMKNSISYGISRGYVYLGKLIVEILYSLAAFVIITAVHIAAAYLLLENSEGLYLELLLRICFLALPLFLFAIAATNCIIFLFESTGAATTAIIGLLIAVPYVSNFLGMKFEIFRRFSTILPWNMLSNIAFDETTLDPVLPWKGAAGYSNFWMIGMIEMLLITIVGFMIFRKKEIK